MRYNAQPLIKDSHMLKAWFNPSHIAAGFIAVLVGYTSSAVIIFQAAEAAGARVLTGGKRPEAARCWPRAYRASA